MSEIIDFLKTHPLLNIYGIEAACGISHSTIANAIAGRRKIPQKHVRELELFLSNYGFRKTKKKPPISELRLARKEVFQKIEELEKTLEKLLDQI